MNIRNTGLLQLLQALLSLVSITSWVESDKYRKYQAGLGRHRAHHPSADEYA